MPNDVEHVAHIEQVSSAKGRSIAVPEIVVHGCPNRAARNERAEERIGNRRIRVKRSSNGIAEGNLEPKYIRRRRAQDSIAEGRESRDRTRLVVKHRAAVEHSGTNEDCVVL